MSDGLHLSGLSCGFGGRSLLTVDELSLLPGEAITVVGRNGAGKSTLLRTLCGLIPALGGQIRLGGVDPLSLPLKKRATVLAMLPQNQSLDPGMVVRDLVGLGRTPYLDRLGRFDRADVAAVEQAARRCDVEHLLDIPLGRLSGGERQRARLAMMLAQQAPLLLLDEPTNHLDVAHRHQLAGVLERLRADHGAMVVMVCHALADARRFAARTMLVQNGGTRIFDHHTFDQLETAICQDAEVPADWVY